MMNMGNKFCTHCGNKLDNVTTHTEVKHSNKNSLKTASIVLGIIAIIGSIIIVMSSISLILSIIGLVLGINATKEVSNILGIVLNKIGMVLSIIVLLLFGLFINWVINLPDHYNDSYYEEVFYLDNFGNYREYY